MIMLRLMFFKETLKNKALSNYVFQLMLLSWETNDVWVKYNDLQLGEARRRFGKHVFKIVLLSRVIGSVSSGNVSFYFL